MNQTCTTCYVYAHTCDNVEEKRLREIFAKEKRLSMKNTMCLLGLREVRVVLGLDGIYFFLEAYATIYNTH